MISTLGGWSSTRSSAGRPEGESSLLLATSSQVEAEILGGEAVRELETRRQTQLPRHDRQICRGLREGQRPAAREPGAECRDGQAGEAMSAGSAALAVAAMRLAALLLLAALRCPLYPQKRTSVRVGSMSAKGQKPTLPIAAPKSALPSKADTVERLPVRRAAVRSPAFAPRLQDDDGALEKARRSLCEDWRFPSRGRAITAAIRE